MGASQAIVMLDVVLREAVLFAAFGFLVGGIDDLLVDLIFLARRTLTGARAGDVADLPGRAAGRLAVFVPAWDEAAVIGAMLRTALARFVHDDYRLYVGCYPNDPATIDAVAAVARDDPRVRVVVTTRPGPTTKADCLNHLWRAMLADDAAAGETTRAVVLHDAEDVVHPAELRVYDHALDTHDLVQIPVLPLIDARAQLISGHYADEFAYAHGAQLTVRAAIGAGVPLAGVGCAISVAALRRLEDLHGLPFDDTCLTEDYELGLRTAQLGLRCAFAVYRERGTPVAVRAYFPATLKAAVVQKSRWMTGIALAGWDRIGWGRVHHVADHWMRMRDRRAPLAVIVLAVAYAGLALWPVSAIAHGLLGTRAAPLPQGTAIILWTNVALLAWRLAARAVATGARYGGREAAWSLARAPVANIIALMAARRAVVRYARILAGGPVRWDKTAHIFPDQIPTA